MNIVRTGIITGMVRPEEAIPPMTARLARRMVGMEGMETRRTMVRLVRHLMIIQTTAARPDRRLTSKIPFV